MIRTREDIAYVNQVFADTPKSRQAERDEIVRLTQEFIDRGGEINAKEQDLKDANCWNGRMIAKGFKPETIERIKKVMVMSCKGINKSTICQKMNLHRSTVNRYIKIGVSWGLGGIGIVSKRK